MEAVNHPAHYNIPGRKECIDEMLDLYGLDAVLNFCVLNSYKYLYRHELKNGQEDLDKAKWYQDKGLELAKNSGKIRIAEHYGLEPQMQQLIEEMSELTQAICKHKRKNGDGQPVADNLKIRDLEHNLVEELADVRLVSDELVYLMDADDAIRKIQQEKIKRTFERMVKE